MKKIIISIFLFCAISSSAIAASNSFKTYTPLPPHHYYHKFNNNNGYVPPPPKNFIKNKKHIGTNTNRKWYPRRKFPNSTYYSYNGPYYNYYPQRQSIFSSIGNFFSQGKMTGFTPSNSSSFEDIPYGYQNYTQTPNGDYYLNDYGFKNGASVKILD